MIDDCQIENKGEELVITIRGDKEKLALVEKKIKALRELCCGDEECC